MVIKYYLVGGAVRDSLLGKFPHDYDFVVVGATEEYMKSKYGESVGVGFPVYLGYVPGKEHLGRVEIAMARKETKVGEGHKGFTFEFGPDVTIEEDLLRRDFTINAIAIDGDGNIIDPYNGQYDLNLRCIRHVNDKGFVEDPLRVLRMARFAAKFDFWIKGSTINLASGVDISSLTVERIWTEMVKALETDRPEHFFWVLKGTGHLKTILPELIALDKLPQAHHNEDAYQHTMDCLKSAVAYKLPVECRFAMLLHDLGKGTTPKDVLPKHIGHEERGKEIAREVCDRFKVPNKFRDIAVWFARNHMRLHKLNDMGNATLITLAEEIVSKRLDLDHLELMELCDSNGRYDTSFIKLRIAIEVIKNTNADDIVAKGFKGKQVGELLHQKIVESFAKKIKELNLK